ncbi:MAG: family 20 glycosylhydrolase [Victivallaceae bacterium]|nr:family 20 glycosylhydrolase [Victivallaceae bacterium]
MQYLFAPVPRKIQFDDAAALCMLDTQVEETIDRTSPFGREGYLLKLAPGKITIVAGGEAGAFYARGTLEQIRMQSKAAAAPAMTIEDSPEFPVRGIMLDVSRDKVPTMENLFRLIDRFAALKLNHLELYIEHTYAYQNHRRVWEHSSPFTAEEIRALDDYCAERFIELVPFQNSFGHLHRWLKFDEYKFLAETPEGIEHPWSRDREPFSLCPADPKVFDFLDGLYREYLSNFRSANFCVGCDETIEIGTGRSKEACRKAGGVGKLYLEYLKKLDSLVRKHRHTMICYSDIIMKHPELLKEFPRDVILQHWGYSAFFPFETDAALLEKYQIPFMLVPSNAAYSSFGGRTHRMLCNIRAAAFAAQKHHALGLVTTEWGDWGHWTAECVSMTGYLYTAAMSWNPAGGRDLDLAGVLDTLVYRDKNHVIGALLRDLGNVYLPTAGWDEAANLFQLVHRPQRAADMPPFADFDTASLRQTLTELHRVTASLETMAPEVSDAAILHMELTWARDMLEFAAELALDFLKENVHYLRELTAATRQRHANRLFPLIERHRQNFLARGRAGGVNESVGWFDPLLEELGAKAPRRRDQE